MVANTAGDAGDSATATGRRAATAAADGPDSGDSTAKFSLSANPKEMLEMVKHYSVEQRVAAFALRTIADLYCDAVHDSLRTSAQVISILHKECPGYSERTYVETLTAA